MKPRITLSNRLRSGYHRIWYEAPQAWWWSPGTYRKTPSMTGLNLSPSQGVPTEKLAATYRTRYELGYPPEPTLPNDDYPDVLGPAHRALNWDIAHHQQVYDVGSANFAYAAALQAFFHPSHLVGTEVNGHRLYCYGRSRIDYAHGHIQTLPHTNYAVTDYRQYKQPRRNHPCLGSLRHSQTAPGLALVFEVIRSGCPICSHRQQPCTRRHVCL